MFEDVPTNDDEYVVEEIVGKKMIVTDAGSKLHYHIKWKGWASAHNTYEPLENLEGCLELVNAYEEDRTERRNKGLDSDPEPDSIDLNLLDLEHREKTRKEVLECGVACRWPAELIPVAMVGAVNIDKHLCYIVRHQTKNYVAALSAENTVIVRADSFRIAFPHIVIKFYEDCIIWVDRAETKEELEFKALRALEISKLVENAENSTRKQESDENVEEDELDEDGLPLPKIAIKNNVDLYGLPLPHADSSSSSDDEYTVKPIPNPVLAQRNQ